MSVHRSNKTMEICMKQINWYVQMYVYNPCEPNTWKIPAVTPQTQILNDTCLEKNSVSA